MLEIQREIDEEIDKKIYSIVSKLNKAIEVLCNDLNICSTYWNLESLS